MIPKNGESIIDKVSVRKPPVTRQIGGCDVSMINELLGDASRSGDSANRLLEVDRIMHSANPGLEIMKANSARGFFSTSVYRSLAPDQVRLMNIVKKTHAKHPERPILEVIKEVEQAFANRK